MSYQPCVISQLDPPMFICSQDGDVVGDQAQHTAYHRYLTAQAVKTCKLAQGQDIGDLARELQDEIDQSHVELAHADEVAGDGGGLHMHEQIRDLTNRLEQKRIELEVAQNTHRQDLALRAEMQKKIDAADIIVARLGALPTLSQLISAYVRLH